MSCANRRINNPKYCAGDLRNLATLQSRAITPSNTSVDYTEVFSDAVPNSSDVWVALKTVNGVTVFDSTNIERVVSHEVIMRYQSGITAEKWFLIDGLRYDILKVENVNERNEWIRCKCTQRGTSSSAVNAQ